MSHWGFDPQALSGRLRAATTLESIPSEVNVFTPRGGARALAGIERAIGSSTPTDLGSEFDALEFQIPSVSALTRRQCVDIRNLEKIQQVCDAMRDEAIRQDIMRFAQSAHSEEAFLFWEDLNLNFKTAPTTRKKVKYAKSMVKKYFESGGPYELNTSLSLRVQIIDRIERGDVDNDLFAELEFELSEEGGVLQDVFRRYKSITIAKEYNSTDGISSPR
jgi:hypothetical protein